jgi:GH18 family chitinase
MKFLPHVNASPFFAGLVLSAALTCSVLPAAAGPVISWVAPYKVEATKATLQKDFGGVGMKDGLTWLALQFWVTNGGQVVQDGNVAGAGFDDKVKWFRDWGKANNVKVALCVTDYVGGWNWNEARRSFNDNRAAFVASLVAEVDRLNLDGVELDLEGVVAATAQDSIGFIAFSKDLSTALHAKGKTVTVASFAAQWNAPNWNWWPELMKSVDGVTSMGYEETGKGSNNGFNYADQKKRAIPPHKLMIGMPGHVDAWQGNSVVEQLDWVVADGQVGVGIWEASLPGAGWQTKAVWEKLKKIKETPIVSIVPMPSKDPALAGPSQGKAFDAKGARLLPEIEPPSVPVFRLPANPR